MLDVYLLGEGGTMPLPGRWLSSVLVRHDGRLLLLDCGEGTQIPLRAAGWGLRAIDTICITHFHGDHVGGLPGLLLTLGNAERREPLTICGPPGLAAAVRGLRVIAPRLPYEVAGRDLGRPHGGARRRARGAARRREARLRDRHAAHRGAARLRGRRPAPRLRR